MVDGRTVQKQQIEIEDGMWSAKKYNKNKLSGNMKIYNEIQIYVPAVCSR